MVLCTLISQLQSIRKGVERRLPESFVDVLGPSGPRKLALDDPGVQWISFLLRDGRAMLAVRTFSTFLYQGYHFSSKAIKHLCEDASWIDSNQPGTVFAEYISTLSEQRGGVIPIIGTLIKNFHLHGKHAPVLILGSLALARGEPPIEPSHYRHILHSMFRIHRESRKNHLGDNISTIKALLSFLDDWLQAFHRDGHQLNQRDITILIPQLLFLLQKHHRRERPLPQSLRLWVLSLIKRLSIHLSDPVSKLFFADAYLNSLDGHQSHAELMSRSHGNINPLADTYNDIIRWISEWKEYSLEWEKCPTASSPSIELFAMTAHALRILVRDRIAAGDDSAVLGYIQEFATLQSALSRALIGSSSSEAVVGDPITENLLTRQYIQDARLRYTTTMIRVCSYYLRRQRLSTLLVLLPFTIHIEDLKTFVRLWKRTLLLVTKKGRWGGTDGVDALLSLLARSIPPAWKQAVVGKRLFRSPTLLEATLRVALGKSSQQKRAMEKGPDQQTAELMALAQEDPSAFRCWGAAVGPFIKTLRSPWKNALKQ